ncbi:hypothetical protein B0J13DRAFT_138952 [Dactylonectria estremocensis]|uniref:Antifreeze protein n=1 Tax=Dactylonectria estremocensis TaxID=1079267 RepID=A0A9P9E2M8_9HYPO|nr:hypothetical protein B0J13DRAFT_138952 [Dactylonectria estremocensis]
MKSLAIVTSFLSMTMVLAIPGDYGKVTKTVTVTDTTTKYVPTTIRKTDTITETDTITKYVPTTIRKTDTITETDTVTKTKKVTVTKTITKHAHKTHHGKNDYGEPPYGK